MRHFEAVLTFGSHNILFVETEGHSDFDDALLVALGVEEALNGQFLVGITAPYQTIPGNNELSSHIDKFRLYSAEFIVVGDDKRDGSYVVAVLYEVVLQDCAFRPDDIVVQNSVRYKFSMHLVPKVHS